MSLRILSNSGGSEAGPSEMALANLLVTCEQGRRCDLRLDKAVKPVLKKRDFITRVSVM